MTEGVERLLFIWKTRLRVAWKNYVLDNAFAPSQWLSKRSIIAAVSIFFLLIVAGTVNKNFIVGESTASIASVSHTIVDKAALNRAKKASALEFVRKKLEDLKNSVIEALQPQKMLDDIAGGFSKRFAIAVDKSSNTLFVLRETNDFYELVTKYEVSIGKEAGVKEIQGDLKTPEGLYRIVGIKEKEELTSIYGPRAFVLNYPNDFDRKKGRTGGGIWIHGSGLGQKTPDTKGCVELDDENVIALGQWIDVDTPIAIFPVQKPLPIVNGKVEKRYFQEEIFYGDIISPSSG